MKQERGRTNSCPFLFSTIDSNLSLVRGLEGILSREEFEADFESDRVFPNCDCPSAATTAYDAAFDHYRQLQATAVPDGAHRVPARP